MDETLAKRPASASLWRHAGFMRLWSAQTISEFGSRISREGLPLTAVLTLGATPAQMGLLSALGGLPVLLVGLFAGVWTDRVRRRPLLIWADLGRALLLGSIPLAALLGRLSMLHLLIVAGLTGALTALFDVAHIAYVPGLVRREHILEANSKLETTDSLAEIAGPPLTGLLVQLFSAPLAILFDALSFIASALFLGAIGQHEPTPAAPEARAGLWSEIRDGLHFLWSEPVLRPLAASLATRSVFGGFFGALYALYVVQELGISPALMGLLIGLGGIGGLLGALVAAPLGRRLGPGRTLIFSMAAASLLVLCVPLAGNFPRLALPLLGIPQLAGDALLTIFFISEVTLRQTRTPDHLLGRVNASVDVLAGGLQGIGALLAGVLGGALGVHATMWIAGLGVMSALLWLLAAPALRNLGPAR